MITDRNIIINDNLITINTDNTTYQMKVSKYGHLLHLYYGTSVTGDMSYLFELRDRSFSPVPNEVGMDDRTYSLDVLPQEFSSFGNSDFRTSPLIVSDKNDASSLELKFVEAEVIDGKYSLEGLPSSYAMDGDDVKTLIITMRDEIINVEVKLYYAVFPHVDVITRACVITNAGSDLVHINKASSIQLDLPTRDYDIIHLRGRYGHERMEERIPLVHGSVNFTSRRGISSHQENPFFMLVEKNASETAGVCYGFNLLYSGDFLNEIELDPYDQVRVLSGISSEQFEKCLAAGESFVCPEGVMSTSDKGIEALSASFHRFIRKNICRGSYKESRRPVLINNWEATYFDFTGDKLVEIAKKAAELGVELFVLDDGWFGHRNDDKTSLGDWFVNEDKLCGSLRQVSERVRELGMKFGLWIEPEMISEDSELYKAHPDYAFVIPGRKPVRGRSQLLLDFSRSEVVDNVFDQISHVLDESVVDYLKIDMNRSINEVYSATADVQNRGLILYKYVLGMYDFLDRLNKRYPDMLIEGCCGGGGRFDLGMLCYVPQIWCSDNTDAIERLSIQHGTSLGYPMSTIGAHVSAVPNHQTGRITPIRTRGIVAMCGGFGYELDLNLLSDEDKAEVKGQIDTYKKDWKIIQQGSYYRLTNPLDEPDVMSWEYVSEDKQQAIFAMTRVKAHCNAVIPFMNLRGLDDSKIYHIEETGLDISGSALMNAGFSVPDFAKCEYDSMILHLYAD